VKYLSLIKRESTSRRGYCQFTCISPLPLRSSSRERNLYSRERDTQGRQDSTEITRLPARKGLLLHLPHHRRVEKHYANVVSADTSETIKSLFIFPRYTSAKRNHHRQSGSPQALAKNPKHRDGAHARPKSFRKICPLHLSDPLWRCWLCRSPRLTDDRRLHRAKAHKLISCFPPISETILD